MLWKNIIKPEMDDLRKFSHLISNWESKGLKISKFLDLVQKEGLGAGSHDLELKELYDKSIS